MTRNQVQSSSDKLFSILQYSDTSGLFSIHTWRETGRGKSCDFTVFSDFYSVHIWHEIALAVQFCQRSNNNSKLLKSQQPRHTRNNCIEGYLACCLAWHWTMWSNGSHLSATYTQYYIGYTKNNKIIYKACKKLLTKEHTSIPSAVHSQSQNASTRRMAKAMLNKINVLINKPVKVTVKFYSLGNTLLIK